MELKYTAELAFETIYHKLKDDMSDEAAIQEACKVYREICGEDPDLKDQMGFDGWFDEETIEKILCGTWQD